MLAVALIGIVGFAGLGSEVAAWYFTTRSMQAAADSAAASPIAMINSDMLLAPIDRGPHAR